MRKNSFGILDVELSLWVASCGLITTGCAIILYGFLDVDECLSEPCENGGTCLDEASRYECQCVDGFRGDNCEIGKLDLMVYWYLVLYPSAERFWEGGGQYLNVILTMC